MQRSAPRIAPLLVCTAVPVMLIAGCSPGSGSGSGPSAKDSGNSASPSASASPVLAAAKYTALPDPCRSLSEATVKKLVAKVKDTGGDAAKSSDVNARGGCSWNGLDGYQYRWLDVTLQRFESVVGVGSAEDQAEKRYQEQATESAAVKGARSGPVAGLGDEATTVTAEVEKDKEEYQDATVIARTGNVVVVLSFNGAGLEDAKTPEAADVQKGAVTAAKEAVASVVTKNT